MLLFAIHMQKNWFEDWFDTAYYKELYKKRDEEEASMFIEPLVRHLQLPTGSKILDVACGRGRHALALNQMGFDVTGIDLSFSKIMENQRLNSDSLNFFRHDMRHIFRVNYFDCVLNLFTSFGYFDSIYDEKKASKSISANLKWNGLLLIDFFNAIHVLNNLTPRERIETDNFIFNIERTYDGERIIKQIKVSDGDVEKTYLERVRLYKKDELIKLFGYSGLQFLESFGSYQFDPFDLYHSERMILLFTKPGSYDD